MFNNFKKSAFDENNKPYIRVFKEWLEEQNQTSILELIDWEKEGNKIKISTFRTFNLNPYSWNLHLKKKYNREDGEELKLELEILIYQWLRDKNPSKSLVFKPYAQEIKDLQKALTSLRYWRKKKKQALFFGIILALSLTAYLIWPKSNKTKN